MSGKPLLVGSKGLLETSIVSDVFPLRQVPIDGHFYLGQHVLAEIQYFLTDKILWIIQRLTQESHSMWLGIWSHLKQIPSKCTFKYLLFMGNSSKLPVLTLNTLYTYIDLSCIGPFRKNSWSRRLSTTSSDFPAGQRGALAGKKLLSSNTSSSTSPATFIVKAMSDLVPDHHSNASKVHRLGEVLVVKRGLQDAYPKYLSQAHFYPPNKFYLQGTWSGSCSGCSRRWPRQATCSTRCGSPQNPAVFAQICSGGAECSERSRKSTLGAPQRRSSACWVLQ